MMFCPNCGAEIEEYNKFCPYCGTRITTEEQISESPPSTPPPQGAQPTPDSVATPSSPPPSINNLPEPPPQFGTVRTPPTQRKGILGRVDKEDFDDAADKAKKGLGSAWKSVKRGISKGAQFAGQGIESAKDTLEERRTNQRTKNGEIKIDPKIKFCPNCGHAVSVEDKFCENCGNRIE